MHKKTKSMNFAGTNCVSPRTEMSDFVANAKLITPQPKIYISHLGVTRKISNYTKFEEKVFLLGFVSKNREK